MRNIMVDNWFMEDVIDDLGKKEYNQSQSLMELLSCIMLWDEVYYPMNSHNWWNTVPSEVQNHLIAIDDHDESGLEWSLKMEGYIEGYDVDVRDWTSWKNLSFDNQYAISAGALRYMRLSHINKCDYMPCLSRRKYISSLLLPGEFLISKLKCQSYIDQEIKDMYIDTFKEIKELIPNPIIDIPLISNYILANKSDEITPIDYAMHLKNENAVVKYREYLDALSEAIEKNNNRELKHLIGLSKEAVSDVIKVDRKGLLSTKFSISLFPSLLFEIGIGKFGLSAGIIPPKFKMSYETNNYNKFHLSFLKDLTEQLF